MRTDAEIVKKNIELGFEFSRFALSHPEIERKIPQDAVIIFEVDDDPELTKFNRDLAARNTARHKAAHQSVVLVRIKGLAPSRLLEPKLALVS